MTLSRRDREQIEADLRLYPRLPAMIQQIAEQHGYDLPPPSWTREAPHTSGTGAVSDHVPRQAQGLWRDQEYQRARALLQAISRLRDGLDARLRRVWDLCYHQGMEDAQAAVYLGCSGRTVRRYREEIQKRAHREFQAYRVSPYKAS